MKLSRKALKIKSKLIEEYELDDSGGLAILQAGLEAFDRAAKAMQTINKEGMTLPDRFGALKAHPLLNTERDARSQWLHALKMLNLDIEPLKDRAGRPSGT